MKNLTVDDLAAILAKGSTEEHAYHESHYKRIYEKFDKIDHQLLENKHEHSEMFLTLEMLKNNNQFLIEEVQLIRKLWEKAVSTKEFKDVEKRISKLERYLGLKK